MNAAIERAGPLRVYLAARYSRREEMLRCADDLRNLGIEVTSRWITGSHESPEKRDGNGPVPYTVEERAFFANEDLADVRAASVLIAFTETPRTPSTSRGGRHVETGYALGLGKAVVVVGPRENVFCCIEDVTQFEDWEACLRVWREGRVLEVTP